MTAINANNNATAPQNFIDNMVLTEIQAPECDVTESRLPQLKADKELFVNSISIYNRNIEIDWLAPNEGLLRVEIFSLAGKQIETVSIHCIKDNPDKIALPMPHASPGLYLVRIILNGRLANTAPLLLH